MLRNVRGKMDFDEVVDDDFTESKVATDEFDVPEAEPQRYLPVNQYQVRPSLDQTFQITKVRQILQDVLSETLSGMLLLSHTVN